MLAEVTERGCGQPMDIVGLEELRWRARSGPGLLMWRGWGGVAVGGGGRFLVGGRGCFGRWFAGFTPMLVLVEGSSSAALLDVGGNGDCGDDEADELPLATAEAAHGVAHHEDELEVFET